MISWHLQTIFFEIYLRNNYVIIRSHPQMSLEVDSVTRVQILDETVCFSHNANSLGKGMHPTSGYG